MSRVVRLAAAAVVAATALPLGLIGTADASPKHRPTAATAAHRKAVDPVTMRVLDITPSTPVRSIAPRPLVITVQLRNTTAKALSGVRIEARRGDPIGNQRTLDTALADRTPPDYGLDIGSVRQSPITLDAGAQVTTTFRTTTSIINDGSGLCLCDNVIYPLYLRAEGSPGGATGERRELGIVATYVPSLYKRVDPVKVSWVWPLIDRPHRLTSDTVFVDDALTPSVQSGALDRALQVVQDVDPAVPMTLVVDPELLDELSVMATGRYTVRGPTASRASPGTGQEAAQQWLNRFQAVLGARSNIEVSLTPYADPDVEALTRTKLAWSSTMPTAMTRRVTEALGGRPVTGSVSMPPGGTLSSPTLNSLASSGAQTFVLDSARVTPRVSGGVPSSLARLSTTSGSVSAALTSPAIQGQVQHALDPDGDAEDSGAAALPALTAEIAIRAIQHDKSPNDSRVGPHVVITPPRHIDPADPAIATRMINETSSSAFSSTVSLADYTGDRPDAASKLRTPPTKTEVPSSILGQALEVSNQLPALASLLSRSPDADPLLATLPAAVQRTSSAAWRPSTPPFGPAVGGPLVGALSARVDGLMTGVRIVRPSSGSYTLGSGNSDLPITIDNRLPYTVSVQISIQAKNGLPGFAPKTKSTQIAPNSKQLVRVPAVVQPSIRIPVEARLSTPNGSDLGRPVGLFVQSTVFGVIGLVITVGAGGVLLLALVLRYAKRVRRIRARTSGATQPPRVAVPGAVE